MRHVDTYEFMMGVRKNKKEECEFCLRYFNYEDLENVEVENYTQAACPDCVIELDLE